MVARPGETVKGLSWKLLYGNYRKAVGPQRWDALIQETGGPDVVRIDPMDDVPMEPLNRMVRALDREVGRGTGSEIDRIAEKSVQAWANFNKNLVKQLQGDPGKMVEVFATEVHPFFLNDPGASRIVGRATVKGTDGGVIMALPNGLDTGFKVGLLRGFVALTGAQAEVRQGDEEGHQYQVAWTLPSGRRGNRAALLMNTVRAPFLTATAVPVLVGWALAWYMGHFEPSTAAHWGVLGWVLGTVALFHLGTNALNDYFDHRSGADEANYTPTPFSGGSRVIQRGLLEPGGVLRVALWCFGLGALLGLALLWATDRWPLFWFGVGGALLGFLYTAPPVRLSHRGLGELAVAVGLGPLVVVGTWVVFSGATSPAAWTEALLASIPVALLVAAILYVNQFPDRVGDAAAGKRTLVVRLPGGANVAVFGALVLGAYGAIVGGVLAGALPAWSLLALATAFFGVWTIRKVGRDHDHPYKLIPANAATILVLHLGTGALLVVGVLISTWLQA